jgi:S-(hydroxymethyl)glutathione synthase
LYCYYPSKKVEISITGNILHNYICGYSKSWKLAGTLFSVVGVITIDIIKVTANRNKLDIIDKSTAIQYYTCKQCSIHLFGYIEKEHAFKGLDFIHVELSDEKGWQEPQFTAFVSLIIEQGFDPKGMIDVRSIFKYIGLETFDMLSPPLMDTLSTFTAKQAMKL